MNTDTILLIAALCCYIGTLASAYMTYVYKRKSSYAFVAFRRDEAFNYQRKTSRWSSLTLICTLGLLISLGLAREQVINLMGQLDVAYVLPVGRIY